jgi:parallel beta-helix repeat protein
MKNLINASLVLLFLTSAVAIALAQETLPNEVQCGDVLGPGGVYKLNKDLYCNATPAITVLDGAHLNLNGHTLTCGPGLSPIGIQLKGQRASVVNGTVLECDRGVVLGGSGKHRVSRIEYATASPGTCQAFVVKTDGNRLVRNSATGCDGCFEISGDGNWLIYNFAYDGPGVGFWLFHSGENNHLFHNIAVSHYAEGFLISGENNNLIGNEAVDTLFENGAGFEIGGAGNRLWRNRSSDNGGDGLKLFSASNRLMGNVAKDNQKSGIIVYGTDNIIIRNKAFGNGNGVNFFDLNDDNLNCDNNIWNKNKFDTRNSECIE